MSWLSMQAMAYSLSRMKLSSGYHFWAHVLFAFVIACYMILCILESSALCLSLCRLLSCCMCL